MKRRSFLRFLGAGAVAGPAVATTAIKSAPIGANMPTLSTLGIGGSMAGSMNTAPPTDWKVSRIAELKSIISGDKTEDQIRREKAERVYLRGSVLEQNVMALNSCSAGTKVRMIRERMDQIEREKQRLWADYQLWQLLTGRA